MTMGYPSPPIEKFDDNFLLTLPPDSYNYKYLLFRKGVVVGVVSDGSVDVRFKFPYHLNTYQFR